MDENVETGVELISRHHYRISVRIDGDFGECHHMMDEFMQEIQKCKMVKRLSREYCGSVEITREKSDAAR